MFHRTQSPNSVFSVPPWFIPPALLIPKKETEVKTTETRRTRSTILLIAAFLLLPALSTFAQTNTVKSIYDISIKDMDGKPTSLAAYKGKAILIVNVASHCGYTGQYTGLQALHEKYKDKGLVLVGFPCNDFGAQEPGTNEEIKKFCSSTYKVTFPLYDKLHTIGKEQHPLYQFMTSKVTPSDDVKWNFEKFLVAKDGTITARYVSAVTPDDAKLVAAIESELAK